MFKRIILFMATNILVVATISIILNILGVNRYITASGLDYQALMIFCLVWGMVGSFISLGLSRIMAKWMMGVKVIKPNQGGEYASLVQTVYILARKANLPAMPEVGIYESDEVNAFATGPTKSRSLVAVSSGLLRQMNSGEVEGVLAHEIAHISNGDMVTMTLLQGVVNAFVMFFARIIAFAVSQNVKEENRGMTNMFITFALEMVLGILGVMVVAWFSRVREFKADSGGAKLAGRENMTAALESLRRMSGRSEPFNQDAVEDRQQASMAAFKISGTKRGGLMALFATHPPLEERIQKLRTFR